MPEEISLSGLRLSENKTVALCNIPLVGSVNPPKPLNSSRLFAFDVKVRFLSVKTMELY